MFVRASLYNRREENQLDATERFYCTYKLLNMFRTLTCPSSGTPNYEESCSSSLPHPGHIACCPAPDRRPPATKALHTTCSTNTSIVSSS